MHVMGVMHPCNQYNTFNLLMIFGIQNIKTHFPILMTLLMLREILFSQFSITRILNSLSTFLYFFFLDSSTRLIARCPWCISSSCRDSLWAITETLSTSYIFWSLLSSVSLSPTLSSVARSCRIILLSPSPLSRLQTLFPKPSSCCLLFSPYC